MVATNFKTMVRYCSKNFFNYLFVAAVKVAHKFLCRQIKTLGNAKKESYLITSNKKKKKIKSNRHYTNGITLKRETSGGAHLRGLAPGLQSSKKHRSGSGSR